MNVSGHEVEFEGTPEFLLALVRQLGGLPPQATTDPGGPRPSQPRADLAPAESQTRPAPEPQQPDVREFFAAKKPSRDVEAAAAVAYFYQFVAASSERRDSIDAKFLEEALRLAKYEIPSRPSQTLVNAKAAGYLSTGSGKGQYRLTTVGHNQVAHRMGPDTPTPLAGERRKPSKKSSR